MLVKVNIDENPAISQAFRVQSIPAVYALKDGQVVDGFMGALPEHEVREFVERLLPTAEDDMVASDDRDGRRGQPAGGARDRPRQRGRDRRLSPSC